MPDENVRDENMIAALKRERATYVARGEDDRVAEVDKQLKHYGHNPATDDTAGETTDDKSTPKGRTTPQGAKQTTAEGTEGRQDAKPAAAAKTSAQTAADKRAGGKG